MWTHESRKQNKKSFSAHKLRSSNSVHGPSPHNLSDTGQSRKFLLKRRYPGGLSHLLKSRSSLTTKRSCELAGHFTDTQGAATATDMTAPLNDRYQCRVWLIIRHFTHGIQNILSTSSPPRYKSSSSPTLSPRQIRLTTVADYPASLSSDSRRQPSLLMTYQRRRPARYKLCSTPTPAPFQTRLTTAAHYLASAPEPNRRGLRTSQRWRMEPRFWIVRKY